MKNSDLRHRSPRPERDEAAAPSHPALRAGLLMAGVVLLLVVLSVASIVW
jgi:hypothetical protein